MPGTFIPEANRDNDYLLMDRAGQKAGATYSGVAGIAMQDALLAGEHGAGASIARGKPGQHR